MRQSSKDFMDKLLEDNTQPIEKPDLSQEIAKTIDQKMEQAMKKFEEQMSKVASPNSKTEFISVENEEIKEDIKNEEGREEAGEESNN